MDVNKIKKGFNKTSTSNSEITHPDLDEEADDYDVDLIQIEYLLSEEQVAECVVDQNSSVDQIDCEYLIESVKARPQLWDFKNQNYKNRTMRPQLWEEVLIELNLDINKKNRVAVRKRWDYLRTSYIKSKRNEPSGSGVPLVPKKPFRYANLMAFLDDSVTPRATKSVCNISEDSNTSINSDVSTIPSRSSTPYKRTRTESEKSVGEYSLKKRLVEVIESRSQMVNQPKSSLQLFADMIVNDMSRLPDIVIRRLKLEIQQLINKELDLYCNDESCVIGPQLDVKVCTLGTVINRTAYSSDYCHIEGIGRQSQPMPIRWMSWESVFLGKFTSKSDVWSFAVTLWEILTFAREQPFENMTDEKVIENIGHIYKDDKKHVLLPIPMNCPREIYDLMCECWQRNESSRPNFREVHLFLQRKNLGYKPSTY